MDFEKICSRVREIAGEAGRYIAQQRESFSFEDVEFKGAHNLVSYVDKEAEKMIVARLRELLPEAGYITEEGTATSDGERYRWVIDPLDGTTNFVHGLPPYSVSLALMDGDEVVVGVVYEVFSGEMFWAWKGSGAYLNGKKISVSNVKKMENALVAVGFSHNMLRNVEGYVETIAEYQKTTDGIRRIGSAAVDLAYVACGRFDVFSQTNLAPWDLAAGVLIVRQAGGVVTDYGGGDNYIFGRELVASNPHIHAEFMKTVSPVKWE